MKTVLVGEVMVPLKDYATVSENANLYDAVLALEKAQQEFNRSRYVHRAILVYDAQNKIVGKISQMDILKALEPTYQVVDLEALSRFGYSLEYLKTFTGAGVWDKALQDICKKASKLIVKDFMYTPKKGEYIEEGASLDEAIHQIIVGKHHSLLVTRKLDIVGILRLTDVFTLICQNIKSCKI